jgi:hypothetical protein
MAYQPEAGFPIKKNPTKSVKIITQPVRLPRAVASQNRKGAGKKT